ncbi:MAG: hypothetical protein WC552_01230 [Candidatus Omnitrophota bacterium]
MQKAGIILLFVGIVIFLVLGGAGLLDFIFSPEVPVFLKAAILSIATGVFLIILSSVRENWGKKDKYEEVKK